VSSINRNILYKPFIKISSVFITLMLLSAEWLHAQPVRITATLDSANYLPGDWILIHLSAEHKGDIQLLWNVPAVVNATYLEKLTESTVDSIQQNDFLTENKVITVTTFDTGVMQIPPITCYFLQNGFTDSVITNKIPIYVEGVKIDTAAAPRPIKSPFAFPLPARSIWWYLLPAVILLLLATSFLFYRRLLRKRKAASLLLPKDTRLPHEIAADHIDQLEREKPWEQHRAKEFYTELTQVLRAYIEHGLGLPALENTTQEMMRLLRKESLPLDEDLFQQMRKDLAMADLVKFAKLQPATADHLRIINTVKTFIIKTRSTVQVKEETAI
jgi:hypothetical protein